MNCSSLMGERNNKMTNLTVASSSPATQALEASLKDSVVVFGSFRSFVGGEDASSSLVRSKTMMINSKSLKRSRSSSNVTSSSSRFDMECFMKASEEVEESILFPSIAWPSCDDDDDDTMIARNVVEVMDLMTKFRMILMTMMMNQSLKDGVLV